MNIFYSNSCVCVCMCVYEIRKQKYWHILVNVKLPLIADINSLNAFS